MLDEFDTDGQGDDERAAFFEHDALALCVPALDDIDRGLAAGEFVAFLEPRVELCSGCVTGFEARAYWRHPGLGLFDASARLATVTDPARLARLALAITGSALDSLGPWLAEHSEVDQAGALALAIDANTLLDGRFPSRLAASVHARGAQCEDIVLTIRQRSAELLPHALDEGLRQLAAEGFRYAIDCDDLGDPMLDPQDRCTFSQVRLPEAVTSMLGVDRRSRSQAKAAIRYAQTRGIGCTAEGIDLPEIYLALEVMGCTAGQGSFFASPLEPGTVNDWLREWNRSGFRKLGVSPDGPQATSEICAAARRLH